MLAALSPGRRQLEPEHPGHDDEDEGKARPHGVGGPRRDVTLNIQPTSKTLATSMQSQGTGGLQAGTAAFGAAATRRSFARTAISLS
jgi:hypothetical protein